MGEIFRSMAVTDRVHPPAQAFWIRSGSVPAQTGVPRFVPGFLGQLVLSACHAGWVQAHNFWPVELVDVEPDHDPGARCQYDKGSSWPDTTGCPTGDTDTRL
ncbi:hypothetical protein D2E30_03965 [Mycobacteroides abscessus]|nr:hypothetical protein DDJ88_16400 [Mycobacteroides abscessus]PVA48898.1 hypothetical protein DDJ35_11550 [Mycobacteroides abscessus]RIQ92770.1 hypothetical protein D2E34_06930 [Mycobacteroides abscessus]RIR02433.1 hypothetical protein D2E30_03965 [Mycobacteroides abscessus]RIR04449.1 hypothetical protein D2E35_09260 [Mycobacteroides abscessus]